MISPSDVLFTPLDVPLLDLSLERIQKHGSIMGSDTTFSERFCRTVMLRRATNSKSQSIYNFYERDLNWEWTPLARAEFPDLIEILERDLPFELLTLVTFVSPKLMREVPPHRDFPILDVPEFVRRSEPYALRLSVGNTRDAFYVCTHQGLDDRELDDGRYVFGNLPSSTQFWAMNTTACLHNTLSRPDKETLFICGILDPAKHEELIKRSVEKFHAHVVTRDDLAGSTRPLREVVRTPWSGLYERHPELYGSMRPAQV